MSKPKIRATKSDISGKERHQLFKSVLSRINTALEHRFFLEAIALIESLIADRLESRLGELTNNPVPIDTLRNLLQKLGSAPERDNKLCEIMNTQINDWCGQRNKALHQAAKIEVDKKKEWADFLNEAEKTAKNGLKIFRKYDTQLTKIRNLK